jgi:upstream activation factor subunit UAF30
MPLAAFCIALQFGEKSMPTKTREKKASADKVNALQKPVQPSEELAAIIGSAPLPRAQVVSKILGLHSLA